MSPDPRVVAAVLDPAPGAPAGVVRHTVALDPHERAFHGHYPGFPIFPGVAVVECADRAARAARDDGHGSVLAAVESARFLGPAFPGDVLTLDSRWDTAGAAVCRVDVGGPRGAVARVRLRYEEVGE